MTTDISNFSNVPNKLNTLQSVSECGRKMPENLSLQHPPTEINTVWHQRKKRNYELDDKVDEASSVSRNKTRMPASPTVPSTGKKKVYMMPPMSNPNEEKRRRNAIIAYKNRQLKKKQSQDLHEKVRTLQDTTVQLQDINQQLDKNLRESHEQQTFLSNMKQKLESEIMYLQSLFQAQKEKLAFMQQHLRLINGTIDEDDFTRKLLNALQERILVSSSPLSSPKHITSQCIISPPYITYAGNASPPLSTTTLPYIQLPPLSPIPKSSAAS
ncbi:hypothetical protein E2C01_021499 [Portunus trituberculatus]|uniref:BZIP domain-containing protein n=1 Tax=Portunus trituberculatus TaxID=210409 RepID=A0A5B7E3F3_PORTR|nr:hypothetical protein [Portunus trituberculatus]